jgi:hypothetical protein
MNSCTVLDPLGAQAIRRPGLLSGRGGEDIPGESTSYIFTCILLYCAILILSFTQEYFCLVEGISLETANIIFDKAAWKVIKDVIKHVHHVSTTLYYS